MGLKDLSLQQMIEQSGPWFDPQSEAGQALQQIAPAQGFLGVVESRWQVLRQVPSAQGGEEIARLTQALAEANKAHARLGRGISRQLDSLMELASDPAQQDLYSGLRALLFPNGLKAAIQNDLTTEAGAGALLKERLDTQARARLRAIPLPEPEGGNLEVVADRWITAAADLGTLERQRATLERAQDPNAKPSNVRAAMFAWLNAVKTLKNIVRQANASQKTWDTIFGDLETEERKAKPSPKTPATTPPTP